MQKAQGFGDLITGLEKLAHDDQSREKLSALQQRFFDTYNQNPLRELNMFINTETQRQLVRAAIPLVINDQHPEQIFSNIVATETEPREMRYDRATRTLTATPVLGETEPLSLQVP